MLITSDFVILNVPKSGSSFVRQVIKEIYRRRRATAANQRRRLVEHLRPKRSQRETEKLFLKELMLPNIRVPNRPPDQHGTYLQIPPGFRALPVAAVLRNPYDKLVSDYEFGWWKRHLPVSRDRIREVAPGFPNLTFEGFLKMSELTAEAKLRGPNANALGNLTIEFIQFFFKDPAHTLVRFSDAYVDQRLFETEMAPITFLRQDRLNEDLAKFLSQFGFDEGEIGFCLTHPKVNETVQRASNRAELWTEWARCHVNERERLLLKMLAKLGHCFKEPIPPLQP
jgi:hypothetical protein